MNEVSSECDASNTGSASFAMLRPLLESVESLDGVCDREGAADEHLEDPAEFKCSRGISSLLTRGLESRDFGVPECERFFEASRGFDGVLTGADDVLELRRREDSLRMLKIQIWQVSKFSQLTLRSTVC